MTLRAAPPGIDPDVHTAVTDIYTYVLLLEAEWRRGREARPEAEDLDSRPPRERWPGLRAELEEELNALRDAAADLRDHGGRELPRRRDRDSGRLRSARP